MRKNIVSDRTARSAGPAPGGERGSALLISLMVMVILTLLGIAYILMAETENQIAVNQRNASQALYVAESGARAAIEWFNNPLGGFSVPADTDVDRDLRLLDLDLPPDGDHETLADGSAGLELHKQADPTQILRKPYRGNIMDEFRGSEEGPDIRITGGTFLDDLNDSLFGSGAGTPADPDPLAEFGRITQIDIYEPPILEVGGIPVRHGVATIKVTAQKIRTIGGTDRVLAERSVKVVINEINYPSAGGPLQSCRTTNWTGDFTIHWGNTTVETGGTFNVTGGGGAFDGKFPTGMPYASSDPTRYFPTEGDFDAWYTDPATNGIDIDDPWYKVLVGDFIDNIGAACGAPPNLNSQPCPYNAATYDGETDHSNLFQNQGPLAACPQFDYQLFKTVAQRGGSGIYYYSYNPATEKFKEGGLGAEVTYKQASDDKEGFFFFDTEDGNPPAYDLGNECTNCTAPLAFTSGAGKWGSGQDAFIYLNAETFSTGGGGNTGYQRVLNAPGEPYYDADGDGVFDASESFVNLNYATDINPPNEENEIDNTGGSRDDQGPDLTVDDIIMHGIFYLTGKFTPSGNGRYYGAVIAHKIDTGATVDVWFNERILLNEWPPADSPVPKVYVTVWEVDNL